MFLSPSICTLALVLSASLTSGNPLSHDSGFSLVFPKRNSLTTEFGIFDHQAAKRQIVYDHNKWRRNLLKTEAEGSSLHGGTIAPEPRAHSPSPLHDKRQAVPMYDENNDGYWAANVTIGTPPQPFFVLLDTGSADLWVTSVNCTNTTMCGSKHKYDPSKSSTGTPKPGDFFVQYADNSTTGPVWTETVNFGGVVVRDQYFSPANSISESFTNGVEDGILGLAPIGDSALKQDNFMVTAKKQGALKDAVFGMKLSKNQSEIFLGGTDKNLYHGDLEFHAGPNASFWTLPGGKAWVGHKHVVCEQNLIIDSGTSIVYGSMVVVSKAYAEIPGSKLYDEANGIWTFPCNSAPRVAFSWGTGRHWKISQDNLNLGPVNATSSDCIGALVGFSPSLGFDDSVWILGDSFMKNVYTGFDIDNHQVGFALLK